VFGGEGPIYGAGFEDGEEVAERRMLSVVPFVPFVGVREPRRRWVLGTRSVVRACRRVRRPLSEELLVPFRMEAETSRSSIR
jgi:hypothetical protein